MTLELDDAEAQALKESFMETLQDDAEKLECAAWVLEDPQRAAHVRGRFAALSRLMLKLASV
jgi:hypothetical protein